MGEVGVGHWQQRENFGVFGERKVLPLATCVRHVGDDTAGPDQGQSRAAGLFSRLGLVGYKDMNRPGQSQADCIFSRLSLAGYKVIHSG